MTSMIGIQDSYAVLKSRLTALAPAALLRRDAAIQSAVQRGFPNTRDEDWKYTSLRDFLNQEFKVAAKPPLTETSQFDIVELQKSLISGGIHLVFIDGELSLGLSDTRKAGEKVSFKTLFDAESTDDAKWAHFDSMSGSENVFSKLAIGLSIHGVCIKVPNRQEVDEPIHILHIVTPAWQGFSHSQRVVIEVGRLSQLTVVEEFCTIGPTKCHLNSLTQLVVEEGAYAGYYRIDRSSDCVYQTGQVSVTLERDAHVDTFSLACGSRLNRVNLDVVFEAQGGECALNGLYLLHSDNQVVDHHTKVVHAAPNCISRQVYKGILAGKSKAVFNGKILIQRGATQSEAYQSNKNLLLSNESEVDTKPELQIDNDDVKASHGATVGSIDQQELFYLQKAQSILCKGFANDVALKCQNRAVKRLLEERIDYWFRHKPLNESLGH
ncbi:MAG: Fe-S cluster assembly protein SufD [Proteobacteria bacterium]|nr:Fe-S cluster assembly protein SufD [Pseudomonadota bacterium]